MITKALPSWFLSQRVPACSEGTLCGVSEVLLAQGTGDGQQVSLEGRESWVAAMGGSIFGGAFFPYLGPRQGLLVKVRTTGVADIIESFHLY